MRRKRISAALAQAAREVHDTEEFLAHIGNIADRYRREQALERGPRGRDVRRALKLFRKHSRALSEWLGVAHAKPASLEYEALAKLGAAMHSAPNQTLASSGQIVAWLQQAYEAAAAAESQLSNKKEMNAARIAAEALRATFEHHGVKWSTQVTKQRAGDAVRHRQERGRRARAGAGARSADWRRTGRPSAALGRQLSRIHALRCIRAPAHQSPSAAGAGAQERPGAGTRRSGRHASGEGVKQPAPGHDVTFL